MEATNGFSKSAASSMIKNGIDKKVRKQIVKEAEMEFKLRGKFKEFSPPLTTTIISNSLQKNAHSM